MEQCWLLCNEPKDAEIEDGTLDTAENGNTQVQGSAAAASTDQLGDRAPTLLSGKAKDADAKDGKLDATESDNKNTEASAVLASIRQLTDQAASQPPSTLNARRKHIAEVMRAAARLRDDAEVQQAVVSAVAALEGPVPEGRSEKLVAACAAWRKSNEATTAAGGRGRGDAADQLHWPCGIVMDKKGSLFVADRNNHRVQRFDPGAVEGITVAGGHGKGDAADQLKEPYGLLIDTRGALLVADAGNSRVQRWDPGASEGVTIAGGHGAGAAANQLNEPFGIAIDASGALFVADFRNHRVQRWDCGATEGVTVAGGHGQGAGMEQLNLPTDIVIDPHGSLLVADLWNARVQRWEAGAGEGVTAAGGRGEGSASEQLKWPAGLLIDTQGALLVADSGNHRVQRFEPGAAAGVTVAGGRGNGAAADQLSFPWGLALDAHGGLLIADQGNNRVQLLGASWEFSKVVVGWACRDALGLSLAARSELCGVAAFAHSWRGALLSALKGDDGLTCFERDFYPHTSDEEVDAFVEKVIAPLCSDMPDDFVAFVQQLEAVRKRAAKYTCATILMDMCLPLADICLDVVQLATFITSQGFFHSADEMKERSKSGEEVVRVAEQLEGPVPELDA